MSELIEVLTKDGSYSLRSVFFQENFHSLLGALEETKSKFTATSNLQRFKGKSLNVLDICFGLGYNSQVWTIEFLSKVTENLNPQGYLITYSSSAAVRKTLRNLGLEIFTIKPSFKNRPFWSQGTVAISKFDKNKLKPNFNFEKLSLMEEEHLLTKASIPYRDQDLNSSKDDIIRRRLDEQLFSNLLSTNKWREKWGMTKLSFKS